MAEVIKWLGLQQPQHEKQKCPPLGSEPVSRSAHCAPRPFATRPFSGLLFYEIFIDELWFLFAALHVTLYAAVLFASLHTSFLWANLITLK